MKHSRVLLGFLLLVALAGCTLSEAQGVEATATPAPLPTLIVPTPTATAVPAHQPTDTPITDAEPGPAPDPAAARDTALAFLAGRYPDRAPAPNLVWMAQALDLGGVVGASGQLYRAGDWEIEVTFPLVHPERTTFRILVTHRALSFSWEGQVDASGQVTELVVPDDPAPEWLHYANRDYGFAFSYPDTWTLEEDPAELGVPGGRAPHSVLLTRDTLRLLIQYKHMAEEAMVGPGGHGAGDIVDLNPAMFFGLETVKKALVYEDKVKSVFCGRPIEDLYFWVQLDERTAPDVDYGQTGLPKALYIELDQILGTFVRIESQSSWDVAGWLGYVIGNPPGAQFDDALVLLPEGTGRVGVAGSTPELEAEIVALRDKPEPGKQAHFWGTLSCTVPDVGGCQLLVTRLRYGACDTAPEPVDGWEGTLVSNASGAQFDDYFVLGGRFGAAYGLHSLDSGVQAQIEALRDTGTPFRVWGVLRCGVPDSFGSQIEVSRIER